MASGWMTVWRLDTGELKRFGKDAVKMVEATVQLGAISRKAKKCNRGVEDGAKRKWLAKRILAVIHVSISTPICIVILCR